MGGSWSTNWGESLTLSAESSGASSTYPIEAYGDSFILMQNPADDAYNPSKWTKVEYATDGDDFGYCMTVYDGSSAKAAPTSDTSAFYDAANTTPGQRLQPHDCVAGVRRRATMTTRRGAADACSLNFLLCCRCCRFVVVVETECVCVMRCDDT